MAVQIGCDEETSKKAISLSEMYPEVFRATVGIHPVTAQELDIGVSTHIQSALEHLISNHRECVVGIGETGFDHHYLDHTREQQQKKQQSDWWEWHKFLAKQYHLPMVIHSRDAREKTREMLACSRDLRVVMHCFSEDWEFAHTLLQLPLEIFFSFSGIVTYKNAKGIQEAAKHIPLDRILIETDSPFLAPDPLRGTVNEPANTRYVYEKLCTLRTESPENILTTLYQNSQYFYGLT
jgi:TatD DNase family protein